MPLDLFTHMTRMRFIHTGIVPKLTSFPSLKGLTKLQYLAIAAPYSLHELPNLDDTTSLISLAVVDAHHIKRLPSLHAVQNLRTFGLFYRNEMCCNGFMTGKCDLTDSQCVKRAGEPTVECLSDTIPDADRALITDRTTGLVCLDFKIDLSDLIATAQNSDAACGGVMYRQCQDNGVPGMCINGRMQVVFCNTEAYFQVMRRLQIARGVGEPCDAVEEAWLGCLP